MKQFLLLKKGVDSVYNGKGTAHLWPVINYVLHAFSWLEH